MTARRDFFAFTAGAVAARTVLPIAAARAAVPDREAELIAACAAFERLAVVYAEACGAAEDMAHDATLDRLDAAMSPWLATICRVPAETLGGLRAKARALAAWDGDAFVPNDDPRGCTDERLRASLIRDLLTVRT